ncbi:MAG TPA: glycosyltransferase [Gammaproteobacteria bacterium]|nr:glycosyltransferase [Gammaproteobacteria bacterium]
MNTKGIKKIIALSYYHPWIAGGGHRPHQLLIEDLLLHREVVFICASDTDIEKLITYYSNKEIYHNLSIYLHEGSGKIRCLKNSNNTSTSIGNDFDSLENLSDSFKPDYVRAHNPVESYLGYIEYLKTQNLMFIYDQMDYWQAFSVQPWGDSNVEDKYIHSANLITTISKYLHDILPKQKPIKIIENAISDLFMKKIKAEPRGCNPASSNKHVLYIGAMWPFWFDWDLCFYLVANLPQYNFTFIGATHSTTDENDGVDTARLGIKLGSHENVTMIPEVSHYELTNWLSKADVGIIPFKVNEITLACSPLKVFEYIAADLPVVSSALPEISDYPAVYTGKNYEEFRDKLLVVDKRNLPDSARINLENFARTNTWNDRLLRLDNFILENQC